MVLSRLTLVVFLFAYVPPCLAEAAVPQIFEALALLAQTKTGRAELDQAEKLNIPIHLGPVSRTDITATRVVDGYGEDLKYETQVILAQDKDPVFQALDLAHELVHANHQKNNPFDPALGPEAYVKHGIEGEGGEAAAIAEECRVGQELIENIAQTKLKPEVVQLITARCHFVWKTSPNLSKWKQSFYFVGQHYRNFMEKIAQLKLSSEDRNAWFRKIEAKSPMFASAVAHKPYPLALLEEYVDITVRICEKSKANPVGRVPAAASLLTRRCESVGVALNP